MTSIQSPFTEHYVSALKQQYMIACRNNNYKGIKDILLKLGFSENDTIEMFVIATMSDEDVASHSVSTIGAAISKMREHDLSCSCPNCVQNKQ